MSVNTLSFQQASALLNSIHSQVTGQSSIAILDLTDFVSVAQKTLATGTEPVLNAISQIVGRTIFSNRKYRRRFEGLYANRQRYGYITRKLSIADKDWQNDTSFELVDGTAYTNQFKVCKPNVLQMNFYGQNVFKRCYSVFKDQLDSAFRSPAELSQFMGMVAQHVQNMIEQNNESVARATMLNMMAGKIKANNGVIKVLTEYNAQTGQTLTATTVMTPANFEPFAKWLYARVQTLSDLMTERSGLFQIQVTGKEIMRHTPKQNQKVYMLTKWLNEMKARVQSGAFNESFLSYADAEAVNFWQDINTPDQIKVKPVYLKADGSLEEATTDVSQSNIIGIMFDEDALGLTVMDEWSASSPFEASEGYSTMWFHFVHRWWNDFTEKFIVLELA